MIEGFCEVVRPPVGWGSKGVSGRSVRLDNRGSHHYISRECKPALHTDLNRPIGMKKPLYPYRIQGLSVTACGDMTSGDLPFR
jgi:hypothetical protein